MFPVSWSMRRMLVLSKLSLSVYKGEPCWTWRILARSLAPQQSCSRLWPSPSVSLSSLRDCTTFMKEEGLSNSPGETCTAPEVWPWRQTGMTVCPQPEQPEESHAGMYSWGWAPPASRESSLSRGGLHALSPQSFEWRSPESNWATSEHSY